MWRGQRGREADAGSDPGLVEPGLKWGGLAGEGGMFCGWELGLREAAAQGQPRESARRAG